LLKAAKGGDTVLEVMELDGFSVGDTVRLEAVGTQEDCKVGSLQSGSMILSSPLASNYPVGASVTLVTHSPRDGQGRLGLASVLNFVPGKSFGNVSELRRCALVGSSSALLERANGEQIDSYDTVIRINRIPRGQIQRSLGSKTDVLFLNKKQALLEHVQLMTLEGLLQGSGDVPPTASCGELDNCRNAAIVQKGGDSRPSLQEMVERWGSSGNHSLVGQVRFDIAGISWGFSELAGHVPSTGLMAFVAFLPLCRELDLFGFGGTATADGHHEQLEIHHLAAEHGIQDAMIAGKRPPWTASDRHGVGPDALDWLLAHAGKARKLR